MAQMRPPLLCRASTLMDMHGTGWYAACVGGSHAAMRRPRHNVGLSASSPSLIANVPLGVKALQDSVRTFHRLTPVFLKSPDAGHWASFRTVGGVESTAGSSLTSSTRDATNCGQSPHTPAPLKKSRRRGAAATQSTPLPPAGTATGAVSPKKRGRRPAAAAPAQSGQTTTTAATTRAPRASRRTTKTSPSKAAPAVPLAHAPATEPVSTGVPVTDAGATARPLSAPIPPPRSRGPARCITKRPRTTTRNCSGALRDDDLPCPVTPSVSSGNTTECDQPQSSPKTDPTASWTDRPLNPTHHSVPTVFTPVLYYSHSAVAETSTLSDEAVIAERASITKLFMVSDSVASIFCALPHEDGSISNYLDDVDRATLAGSQRRERPLSAGTESASEEAIEAAAEVAVNESDIHTRVLVEERANHHLCIHVRDMEQLVPPAHLRVDGSATDPVHAATAASTTGSGGGHVSVPAEAIKSTRGGRRGKGGKVAIRKGGKRDEESDTVAVSASSPSAPVSTVAPLSPLERLLELRQWQRLASEKARLSQQRWVVPDTYHAITRVRFHDPHKADLTLVQGAGGSKSVEDVLDAMNRQLGHHGNGRRLRTGSEEEEVDLDSLGHLGTSAKPHASDRLVDSAISMTTPYALKPLLTVYASSVPRREPLFGIRTDQRQFLARLAAGDVASDDANGESTEAQRSGDSQGADRTAATTKRPRRRSSDVDASTQVSAFSPNPLTEEAAYAMMQQHIRIPPMPRFLTRLTLLIEHSELEPVDLLAIAEVTTARKGQTNAVERRPVGTGGLPAPVGVSAAAQSGPSGTATADPQESMLDHFTPPAPRIFCLIIDGGEV